ncbi:MAG: NAD(P)-dependent oxidoreductase, partial [Rubinisphaera sp.]
MTDSAIFETSKTKILVTGATGYIGGRIVPKLLDLGHPVRCLVRNPAKLDCRSWRTHPQLEVIEGNVRDQESITKAMAGCEIAYYLIHSMESAGGDYAKRDRELAEHFVRAAQACSLKQIIYLGGLGELGDGLSQHLSSRREVESILKSSSVPVTAFRA